MVGSSEMDVPPMPKCTINFDTVRKIGLALPGVEESTAYGVPALKVHGNSWRVSPRIAPSNPNRLSYVWLSMTAPSCLPRTPMFTT